MAVFSVQHPLIPVSSRNGSSLKVERKFFKNALSGLEAQGGEMSTFVYKHFNRNHNQQLVGFKREILAFHGHSLINILISRTFFISRLSSFQIQFSFLSTFISK